MTWKNVRRSDEYLDPRFGERMGGGEGATRRGDIDEGGEKRGSGKESG